MNWPDRPQLIITLVNSIGAYKVKRQSSNTSNNLLIPYSYSLYSSFLSLYFHFSRLTFIAHKNAVKTLLKITQMPGITLLSVPLPSPKLQLQSGLIGQITYLPLVRMGYGR